MAVGTSSRTWEVGGRDPIRQIVSEIWSSARSASLIGPVPSVAGRPIQLEEAA
jgi:hypothetical protein